MYAKDELEKWNEQFVKAYPQEVLRFFMEMFGNKIALSSSLSIEDQVLTDMMVKIDKSSRIFTLDTGRLFPETYQLIDKTNMQYGIRIGIYFPDNEQVEKMVNTDGVNLFYDSIENRKRCCGIRKIEPLRRAFTSLDAWICGLRREQSVTRKEMRMVEWDENNGLLKINPLINWTEEQTWEYIKANQVPYNKLHDKGFPSIGCEPCTRAVKPGEDIRAGRWWWEDPDHKECGLHR
ncbi:phosphoadenylyl-sulfate reductase [Bacteroidales bacterium OttesenSCG-928-B11]|nr:phosphoadenylyl-sulfate reductase [Bacteroidales bacterium OttesenSCG-928-E04]MDL2308403.1 phosphoadenylyl-sulfate reductase [Bacteroidales bacterium OttesenSCG-928-C03]MDL2311267.1 phosphoadenylyl-sulfate reductase [Bacteroidales bacterium OttesenSCG-928-B11]